MPNPDPGHPGSVRIFRRTPRAADDLRSEAKRTDPGWDEELADHPGIESHESTDEGVRRPRRDRPLRVPDPKTD